MKGRTTLIVVAALGVGLLGGIWLRSSGIVGPGVHAAPALPPPITAEGQNGLSNSDRGTFYHLSEGGEMFPLDWFLALEVETATANGGLQVRPFMENIERFGLLPDAKSPANRYGLPVGISVGRSRISGAEMIGLNCAACHVNQLQYRGRAVRVDGAGNLALINGFITSMIAETEHTLMSPRRLVRFWERVREVRRERRAAAAAGDPDPMAPDESFAGRMWHMLTGNRGLLESAVGNLRRMPILNDAIAIGVDEGYGRLDAFGIGRDELTGNIAGNTLPPDAPVSIPHVWGVAYTGWLQWGANTNSVMERNIGQALGVGAIFDRKTFTSSVNIENLHRMEDFAYKIQPPEWPDAFPKIDPARAERGRRFFEQTCAKCHETWTNDGLMRSYQLHTIDKAGTDPLLAIGFERKVKLGDGTTTPFAYAALNLIHQVKMKAYEERGLDAQQIAVLEQRNIRRGPQWDPTIRATLLDSEKWPDSRGRKIYRSKTLVGIWATAPYLHNGSVPTVFDLLKPAAERPVTFTMGQREYNPVKLGLETDPQHFTLAQDLTPFTFDTRIAGNWNRGHEWWFYPDLTDEIRYDVIEFLKTHTSPFPAPPPNDAATTPVSAPAAAAPARIVQRATVEQVAGVSSGWLFTGAGVVGVGLLMFMLVRSVSADAARHSASEAEDIQLIRDGILKLQASLAADQDRPLRRGTHAKGRCVSGTFEVFDIAQTIPDPVLAARLAQGLFAKPGVYGATVRFANGNSQIQQDKKPDVRACSFAVHLPEGSVPPRQDYSLNNARVFQLNDAHAFAVTIKVFTAPSPIKGFRSLSWGDKMALLRVLAITAATTKPARVAYQLTRYWSTVPFCHGTTDAAKFSLIPCTGNPAKPLDGTANSLQDEIVRHVTEDEHMSCFDFGIQLLEPKKMRHWGRRRDATYWIENGSVEWKESQAPFHIVGRLTLVRGSVFSEEACEAQFIDVTENSTAASAPLGSLNRARWAAESASRHARMGGQTGVRPGSDHP